MAEFIEILSPSALKELQTANLEILSLIKNIDKAGESMKNIKTPSGSDSSVKNLTIEYQKQEQAIGKVKTSLTQISAAQQVKNKLTGEEIVNNRILAKNVDNLATQNSRLAGAYANLNAKHIQAKRTLQDLIVESQRGDRVQSQYTKRIKEAQKAFDDIDGKIKKADSAVRVFNRNVGNYPKQAIGGLKDLLGAFGVIGGVSLFASVAKDIYQTTKELQSLDNALKQVTDTNENFVQQQTFLNRISEAYGSEIKGLTKQFTQFYVSAKDKISGQEIQDIFESVTKAAGTMGLSVESQQRAFLALNQMMSKGTIQAEELRGQLGEALPGAFGIMAKAMGVTEKQLGKMMKDGQLLAADVLPKFAKQLEITYGIENVKRIETLASAQTRLSNSWTDFVRELSKGDSVLKGLLTGTMNILKNIVSGITLMIESSGDARLRILKSVQQKGYDDMKKVTKSFNDDELKSTKEYNSNAINENANLVRAMIAQNKSIYKKSFENGIFSDKTEKDFKTWKKNKLEINRLNDLDSRLIGENLAIQESLNSRILKTKTEDVKITKDQIKAQEELNKKIEEELRLRNALLLARANRELIGLKTQLENEKLYINDRLALLDEISKKETQIALLKYQENIRLHKDSNTQMEIDAIEFKNTIDEINKERIDNGLKELDRYYKEFEDYNAKFQGEGLKMPELTPEDFEKWREGAKGSKKDIDDLKKATDDWVKSFSDSFLGDAGFPTLFKLLNDELLNFGENFSVTFEAITQIAQEAFNVISEQSNQRFENEKANLQKEKEIALMFAGESSTARAEIERQYEIKQREIKNREAKAKKQQAIFNISIDIAQGIISALATGNIPLSIAIGAIGAVQLAMVAAQQIPQYWEGTDNHKGGAMMVNDQKGNSFKEIIQTPDGKMRMYNERNKILNAPKGTKVFTASESAMMFDNNLNSILANNGISNSQQPTIINVDINGVIEAINNKPSVSMNIDKNGLNSYVRNGHSIKEITNKRINGQSYGV